MNNLAVLQRPGHVDVASPQRLAVFGWSPKARDGLQALLTTGAYKGTAIADGSAMALVEARQTTDLACYQQAWTYLQQGMYDALLIARPDSEDAVRIAAARGVGTIIAADIAESSTLASRSEVAAEAESHMKDCNVFLMQPMLEEAGFQQLMQLLADPRQAPRYLSMTIEAATEPARLLELAVAQFIALTNATSVTVGTHAWGTPAPAIHMTIDSAVCRAHIEVRYAPTPFARVAGETDMMAFEWRSTSEGTLLAHTDADGSRRAYEPLPVDPWEAEARRIVTQAHDDRERIAKQAALLDAIGRALATGEAQQTGCCLRSGHTASTSTARPSHLHLVAP